MNAHGRVGLNDLPLELQQRICRNLPGRDLKQLRLVSRHYASAAARDLPIIIHLFDEPQSCRDALEIARHPDLQIAVTAVAVDVSRITDYEHFSSWIRDIQAPIMARDWTSQGSAENLKKWYKVHQELAYYQSDPSSATVLLDTLTQLLSTCPRLREIIIANVFGAAYARLPYPHQKTCTKLSPFLKPYSSSSESAESRFSLQQILNCLGSSGSLTSLTIMPAHFTDTSNAPANVSSGNLAFLESLKQFQCLDQDDKAFAVLLPILASAKHLAWLAVRERRRSPSFPYRTELFDTIRSDSLEYINVDGWQATPDSFRDFLLHHAHTLKTTSTTNMELVIPAASVDVAWSDLASDLAGRFPKLAHMVFHGPGVVGLHRLPLDARYRVCCKFRQTVMGRPNQDRPVLELEEALRDDYRFTWI
ncbi:hypothetical protein D6D29_08888 [Aureobasidium pullulans]|nr:hypothetical protein D6D29_08888 [Aureobasidium pullulans]TIA52238.1 hypothetical protein D6C79_02121 [Aureobasidium pullulans]